MDATPAEKFAARNALREAIRHGLVVPQLCSKCGKRKGHGHHPDYSRPLDVIWLCSHCHPKEHIRLWREQFGPPKSVRPKQIRLKLSKQYPANPAIGLVLGGMTKAEAAQRCGISHQRVSQIMKRFKEKQDAWTNP